MPARSLDATHGDPLFDVVRHVVPWVLLAAMLVVVLNIFTGYRTSQAAWEAEQGKPKPSQAASATTPAKKPAATAPSKPPTGVAKISKVVVVSSVTFRKDPSSGAEAIRDLKSGDQLTLVGQVGSWYKVTDAKGVIGWVSASDKYTKVVSGK